MRRPDDLLYFDRFPTPTLTTDVLVIGAGPAGSAAAAKLADAGVEVTLVDRGDMGRDKVCGDALIPDALAALDRLGAREQVLTAARRLDRFRLYAPNETYAEVSGACAVIPRTALDDAVRGAATARGARFLPGLVATGPIQNGGAVGGARFTTKDGRETEIRARLTILATGAAAKPLQQFGVALRTTASATAARMYFEVDAETDRAFDHLCVSFDRAICPGYGWIFPGPGRIFNVGVGYFYDTEATPPETNLRALLDRFLTTFAPARRLAAGARPIGPLRGAPLRTGLQGARLSSPGLLVAGEAAGTTYSLTGEGIGKSIQTGLVAAEVAVKGLRRRQGFDPAAVAAEYATRIERAYGRTFRAYRAAQRVAAHPRIVNLLTRRANEGRYVRRQLEAMWNDLADPRGLLTPLGIVRALLW